MNMLRNSIAAALLIAVGPVLAQTRPEAVDAVQVAAPSALTLTEAHGVVSSTISGTGRVHALTSARIGPRVSGLLAEFGKNAAGETLDVGMAVKRGDVLFALDQTTFNANLALAEAQLASAQAALANLTAPTRSERMEQIRQEIAQLDARLVDRTREAARYKQLVEVERSLPVRRLEEVQVEVASLTAQKRAAEARLQEAEKGPTPTEIAMAQAQVKEAEAATMIARNDLRDTSVRAPFDGIITQRLKGVGDYIVNMPPTEVMELVDPGHLEAEIAIPESYLALIKAGETQLSLRSGLLAEPLTLPVTRTVGQVNAQRGTFNVRIAIPRQQAGALVPGSFVTAEMPVKAQGAPVVIPFRAIAMHEGAPTVFVADDGRMVRRKVQVVERLSEGVIVSGQIRDGDKVVLGPGAELVDGGALPEQLR